VKLSSQRGTKLSTLNRVFGDAGLAICPRTRPSRFEYSSGKNCLSLRPDPDRRAHLLDSADSLLVSKCAFVSVFVIGIEGDYLNPEEVMQSLVLVVPSCCAGIHRV
jgi:hypothetical protein